MTKNPLPGLPAFRFGDRQRQRPCSGAGRGSCNWSGEASGLDCTPGLLNAVNSGFAPSTSKKRFGGNASGPGRPKLKGRGDGRGGAPPRGLLKLAGKFRGSGAVTARAATSTRDSGHGFRAGRDTVLAAGRAAGAGWVRGLAARAILTSRSAPRAALATARSAAVSLYRSRSRC